MEPVARLDGRTSERLQPGRKRVAGQDPRVPTSLMQRSGNGPAGDRRDNAPPARPRRPRDDPEAGSSHLVSWTNIRTDPFGPDPRDAWALSPREPLTPPATRYPDRTSRAISSPTCHITRATPDADQALATCAHQMGIHNLTRAIPSSSFWQLQAYELVIFLGVAGAIVAATFWWIRHRPPDAGTRHHSAKRHAGGREDSSCSAMTATDEGEAEHSRPVGHAMCRVRAGQTL